MAMMVIVCGPVAWAQVDRLDQEKLMKELGDRGMSELLIRLLDVDPPKDPVKADRARIAQFMAQYGNPALGRQAQLAALENALKGYRSLIADHRDHANRPIWQVEIAELLLFDVLPKNHQLAAEFYEAGVVTSEQRKTFGDMATEALRMLIDADLRFFTLQSELPRQPEHADRVNSGAWAEWLNYKDVRLPFCLAHASLYVALLPADAPYFRTLRKDPLIPGQLQKDTPEAERQRLLTNAGERLEETLRSTSDTFGIRRPAQSVAGRALILLGKADDGRDLLTKVIAASRGDRVGLISRLVQAQSLLREGKSTEAEEAFDAAMRHPLVVDPAGGLIYRLLVADARHRVLLAGAERVPPAQRTKALEAAFSVYDKLFADPALAGQVEGIRNYVYRRWEASIPADQPLDSLPSAVLAGLAESLRTAGQNQVVEAVQLNQQGDADQAQQAFDAARAKLVRAVNAADALLKKQDIPDSQRARALFNKAYATYLANPSDHAAQLAAATVFTAMAADFSAHPDAAQAVALAVGLLHNLHLLDPRPPGVHEAYVKACEVLFKSYTATATADNERLYYGFYVLQAAGRYEEAADIYTGLPPGHADYWEAQRELIYCLRNVTRRDGLNPTARREARERLVREARRVLDETAEALRQGNGDKAKLLNTEGNVALVLTDLAIEEGNTGEALRRLDGWDTRFADDPQLLRMGMGKLILAYSQAGQLDNMVRVAADMLRNYPDAAAGIIDGLLLEIDGRIESLRRALALLGPGADPAPTRRDIDRLGQTAERLASMLLQWAQGRGVKDADLLPYRLIYARSLRVVGRNPDARKLLDEVAAQFPNDPRVLHESAETWYALGGNDNLQRAAALYKRLADGLAIARPLPPMYWNAWMRMMQIADTMRISTDRIPLRVRQLKVEDSNLGGDPYRSTLEALSRKYEIAGG